MPRLSVVLLATTAAVAVAAAAVACGSRAPKDGWTGGPATPAPITITINPSAPPVGDTIPTGLVVRRQEIILYFWGDPKHPNLDTVWRDTRSGIIDDDPPGIAGVNASASDKIFGLSQWNAEDGTVIEFGAIRGTVSRVTSQDKAGPVEAKFARWSADPSITVFWLRRTGGPVPANTPSGPGLWVPLAPEQYPLITAYGTDGAVLATQRIRPDAVAQRGG